MLYVVFPVKSVCLFSHEQKIFFLDDYKNNVTYHEEGLNVNEHGTDISPSKTQHMYMIATIKFMTILHQGYMFRLCDSHHQANAEHNLGTLKMSTLWDPISFRVRLEIEIKIKNYSKDNIIIRLKPSINTY
jgi:hypothetical protein